MTRTAVASIAAATAALLACGQAHATGVYRAWVSGHGTDAAGCGAPTAPCRSLQYAHDDILAPGGEIDILDPAGYGAITITKSISIVNDGVGTAGVQQGTSGQDAITINVPWPDTVTLRGLTIDGLGVAKDGIGLSNGGSLTVVDCVIRHFTHDGVYLQPTSNLTIALLGTMATDNGANGFDLSPEQGGVMQGVVDHSEAMHNGTNGIVVWGVGSVQGGVGISMTISNSNVSNNTSAGVLSHGIPYGQLSFPGTNLVIWNTISDNNVDGYEVSTGSQMTFSRSEAYFDTAGVLLDGGLGQTTKDNLFDSVSGSLDAIAPS